MFLENAKFDRRKHVYENDQFAELKRRAHRRMKRNEDSLERMRAAGFSRRKIELGLDLLRELNGRGVVRLVPGGRTIRDDLQPVRTRPKEETDETFQSLMCMQGEDTETTQE